MPIDMAAETDSAELPPLSLQSAFPQLPEEFDADPRISFSKVSNKFILETDDGAEYEFDDRLKKWIPVVCPLLPSLSLLDFRSSLWI